MHAYDSILLAVVLAFAIGILLGMLGGGGSILTLPMLVYVARVEPKVAIAMSLFVVGMTSVVGVGLHAASRSVRWRVGTIFGGAAMAGAFAGGRLAEHVSPRALLVAFGGVMVLSALGMLRPKGSGAAAASSLDVPRSLGLGFGVGALSGLIGAGGGFLLVPVLTLLGGLAMREAVGTSLFVIAVQSLAGFAGHAAHTRLDWTLLLLITTATVTGGVMGAFVGKRVPAAALRWTFAFLVLVMGMFVFAKELPRGAALGSSALTGALVFFVLCRASRRPDISVRSPRRPGSWRVTCTTSRPSPR